MLCLVALSSFSQPTIKSQVTTILKKQILTEAAWAMQQKPITVTAETSPLSSGGKHDFFSQADYFWPNPANPTGPYINKDGETNPNNFVAHRKAMIRFSTIIGALASAYQLTGDERFAKQAVVHINAWFVNPATLMNPNLSFSQAVIGSSTGRSWGIIDTIHLMEVAQGIFVMQNAKSFDKAILTGAKKWFADYTRWLNTSKNGVAEKLSANNHSACWVMQVAAFAKLYDDQPMLDSLRWRYKNVLLPKQMAVDGSFPLELARTKAYGYSIFNLDAFAMICQILSTPKDNLWAFETDDKKSIFKGISYLYPFVADKSTWKLKPDVMFWENWPVAQPFLIYGANTYRNQKWFDTWKRLDQKPTNEEVIRNLPIRHALIWM
ncbi:MAG: alginate lyase [Chitinophagaceae bacterium]|nr:MAG: alginate lyase [Chitinophagaceae bacterium]